MRAIKTFVHPNTHGFAALRPVRNGLWAAMLLASVPFGPSPATDLEQLFGPAAPAVNPAPAKPRSPVFETPDARGSEPQADPAAEASPAAAPVAPPPKAEIEAAAARIREVYAKDVDRAGQPQQRPQVVRLLLSDSKAESLTPAQRYALLSLATQLAEQGDELDLATLAIRVFADAFADVDRNGRTLAFLSVRERQVTRVSSEYVDVCLGLNASLRAAERFGDAMTAAELAARLLKKVDPVRAPEFRDRVAESVVETKAEMDLETAAKPARDAIARDAGDGTAHLAAGLYAAFRDDWTGACGHFRQCGRPDLQAAADGEPDDAGHDSSQLCRAADAWWKIAAIEPVAAGDLNAPTAAAVPSPVRKAMKRHAAELYTRALAAGVDDLLLRKEAENRLAELRPASPPLPDDKVRALDAKPAMFDREKFDRVEHERSEQWKRFQRAARQGDRQEYAKGLRELNRIRPLWCAVLAPAVRDASLPQRQDAIRQVVRNHDECSDAHLCESYLHMLAGDRAKARDSFRKSLALIDRNGVEQVFCPRQLLDVAWAAVILDDFETAERINNTVLRKKFPNDPSVQQVQALLFMAQKRPRFADAIDKLKAAHDKTEGEERGVVAASLAWLLAAVPLDTKLRQPRDAEKFADEAIRLLDGRSWRAWRAMAELRASEKQWDAALAHLAQAEAQAPLIHADELDRQRACYRSQRSYEIERR